MEQNNEQILEVTAKFSHIQENEPDVATAIAMVIRHIDGTYSDKYAKGQGTIDTKKFLYHPESGLPINLYQCCRYLQRYNTKGSPKSFLVKDIEKAIHYLIFELTRRIKMEDVNEVEPKV